MASKVQYPTFSKEIEKEHVESRSGDFEARVRYLASSLIITIPVRVARDLNLELGDRVIIRLRKKKPPQIVLAEGTAPTVKVLE